MDKERNTPPKVEFIFRGELKPGELEELIAKRDALFQEMGYLPPDEHHEFWWNPKTDE